ncbi:hypothetical protein [Yoonia sp.]|jgi:hypothetical protein|uniref:hypothetical protein n=1 Tax=Yoonia sp. TaxID=2212373 RepID=UPI0025E8B163|nr:hypothetical protein [Yoonia sp.]
MAIEIGSLVVRGSFGQPARDPDTLTHDQVRVMIDRVRRDFRDALKTQIAAAEQRIKEG